MKTKNKIMLNAVSLLLCGLLGLPAVFAKDTAEAYYTKVNIWYEKPGKIMSTNYHQGLMLSAGSEVVVTKRKKGKIKFSDKTSGTEFGLIKMDKYTNVSAEEFFNEHFSAKSVLEEKAYKAFSDMEKQNIKNGTIEKGMSKDAVIMAYGYPPTHRTPSLSGNSWVYWKSKFVNFPIEFDDKGRISVIK